MKLCDTDNINNLDDEFTIIDEVWIKEEIEMDISLDFDCTNLRTGERYHNGEEVVAAVLKLQVYETILLRCKDSQDRYCIFHLHQAAGITMVLLYQIS
jgi:hypothetical protein